MALTEFEVDQLRSKMEDGLSEHEIRSLGETLLSQESSLYLKLSALSIIGWTRSTTYIPTVEKLLDCADYSGLTGVALRVLYRDFRRGEAQTDVIKAILVSNLHSPSNDLTLQALYVTGLAYLKTGDKSLLSKIVEFSQSESKSYQEAAFDALSEALCSDWWTLTPRQRHDLRHVSKRSQNLEEARRIISQ